MHIFERNMKNFVNEESLLKYISTDFMIVINNKVVVSLSKQCIR